MKKILVLIMAVLAGCSQKELPEPGGFIIKGEFSEISGPMKVKLNYTDDHNRQIFEEAVLKDGEFIFKGKTTASGAELIFMPYNPLYKNDSKEYWDYALKEMEKKQYKGSKSFFLEEGYFELKGTDDLNSAKLETESVNQRLFHEYINQWKSLNKKYFDLSDQRVQDSLSGDKIETALKEKQLKDQEAKITDYAYIFAAKHPDSKVSLTALKSDGVNINPDKLGPAISGLSKKLQSTPVSDYLREIVAIASKNKAGKAAADFALEDPQGTKKTLSSFRGKYVLVDFWASWCGPCRAENPNVLKAYNKFKKENFDIISISIDGDKKAWLKAVEEDKLPWLNLLDYRSAKKSVAYSYGVLSVPTNFLLDPTGKIIAKNLIGEQLHKKLAETFQK